MLRALDERIRDGALRALYTRVYDTVREIVACRDDTAAAETDIALAVRRVFHAYFSHGADIDAATCVACARILHAPNYTLYSALWRGVLADDEDERSLRYRLLIRRHYWTRSFCTPHNRSLNEKCTDPDVCVKLLSSAMVNDAHAAKNLVCLRITTKIVFNAALRCERDNAAKTVARSEVI